MIREKTYTVKLKWLSFYEGGRKAPPAGPRYLAPARFSENIFDPNTETWSLIVDLIGLPDNVLEQKAVVHFISPNAPAEFLVAQNKFGLFEGARLVALGDVLNENIQTNLTHSCE